MQKPNTKELKKRHAWMGKGIHWELDKRWNFNHWTKLYIYKWKSFLDKAYKIHGEFETVNPGQKTRFSANYQKRELGVSWILQFLQSKV